MNNYDSFWEVYDKVKEQIEFTLKSMTINSDNHWDRRYFLLSNSGEIFTSPDSTKFQKWWYENVKYRSEYKKLKEAYLCKEYIIKELHRKMQSDKFNEVYKVTSLNN